MATTSIEWVQEMVTRSKDITGMQFGSLKALRISHKCEKSKSIFWVYSCICGAEHTARGNTIAYVAKKGDVQVPSCGCVELTRKTKHGFRGATDTHPTYKLYRSMLNRCYNEKTEGFKWYGAKGVTVCAEWLDNPAAFCEWAISSGWAPGLHIDKDILCKEQGIYPHVYSPTTCQWVSAKINVGDATNRDNYGKHPNVRLSHEHLEEIFELYNSGKITNKSEIARMYGVTPSHISHLISDNAKVKLTP